MCCGVLWCDALRCVGAGRGTLFCAVRSVQYLRLDLLLSPVLQSRTTTHLDHGSGYDCTTMTGQDAPSPPEQRPQGARRANHQPPTANGILEGFCCSAALNIARVASPIPAPMDTGCGWWFVLNSPFLHAVVAQRKVAVVHRRPSPGASVP